MTVDRRFVKKTERRRSAFTIIEVIIALGILGFGLLTLAGMQVQALSQGSSGWGATEAAAVGRDQLEIARRLPWAQVAPTAGFVAPNWINNPGYPQGDVPVTMTSPSAGTQVVRVFSVTWRVTAVPTASNLMNVDLMVTWNDPSRPLQRTLSLSTTRYNGSG